MTKNKENLSKFKHKLSTAQRLALLQWMAEGLTHQEILDNAANFSPAFTVSSQLVYAYRKTYEIDISKLRSERREQVISTGLALQENRINGLIALALLLEEDLRVKNLVWTKDVKSVIVGKGNEAEHQRIDFEIFNKAEISELRGIYDDIAKETGGRIQRSDVTSLGKQIKGYITIDPDKWPDKPIAEPKK